MSIYKFLFFFFLCLSQVFADTSKLSESNTNQPQTIGNFVLPASQQPGPFFSFGQNIIGKNQLQFYFEPNYLKNTGEHYFETDPYLVYGLTDNASILFALPIAVDYTAGDAHSSGLADASVQVEYAFYQSSNAQFAQQATVLAAVSAPTGSFNKNPPTGFGVPSYFIGGTYNRMYVDWLWFVSPGFLWISNNHSNHIGNDYLYQFGIGRNLNIETKNYILLGLLELDGEHLNRNKILNVYDPNSGGNIIYITPSLWFSTKKFIAQLGLSLPIYQQLNGNQSKTDYYAAVSFGWTFN